jgi:hypothetical protein
MYKVADIEVPTNTNLGDGYKLYVAGFSILVFLICLIAGWYMNGKTLKGYGQVINDSGHKVDFTAKYGMPLTLINFGFYGLFIVAYYLLVGGKFTGATMGAIYCMYAFVAGGANPKNVFPIMIGYALVSLVAPWSLTTQAILVGLCFASGLAPVSGKFGLLAGIVAGAIHCCLVTSVPSLHGGFCLYNGGFTCGIVAFLFVSILTFYKKKEAA